MSNKQKELGMFQYERFKQVVFISSNGEHKLETEIL